MNNEQTRTESGEINLGDLFGVLKKHFILIIIVALVAAILVYGYCALFIKPTYSASSKIYIVSSTGTISISDLTLSNNVASDYIDLMKDKVILDLVIDNLHLNYTASQLSGMISVTNTNGTHMLVITVKSHDPDEAAAIANCLADMTINEVPNILETQPPNVVHYAVANRSKIAPSNTRNALIGAVIGAVVCYGVLFLMYYLDDSIRSSDDIVRYAGLHILGEISDLSEHSKRYGRYGRYGKYGKYGKYGSDEQRYGDKPADSENGKGGQS